MCDTSRKQHRILVVDDDADIRDTVKALLELEGYRVQTAQHGRAALEALQDEGPPCLILLDLMMPVMDGRQFLNRLRSEREPTTANVPVMVVSALDEAVDLKMRYGCEVLRKPVDIDAVLLHAQQHC